MLFKLLVDKGTFSNFAIARFLLGSPAITPYITTILFSFSSI